MKKLLIIQFRTDYTKMHEQECYRVALQKFQSDISLEFIDAIHAGVCDLVLDDVVGVILGGSGEFYLGQNAGVDSWREEVYIFIDLLKEKNIPLLGICFGFQLIALYEGARIVNEEHMREVGMFPVTLFPIGMENSLFSGVPQTFLAPLGHKETIVDLPHHLTSLAKSERVVCQAFQHTSFPLWGILFHPELDKASMSERLRMSPSYAESGQNIDQFIAKHFFDTPDAPRVLENFVAFTLS